MGTPTGGIAGTIPHSVVHEHRCERRTVKPLRDEKHSSIPASLLWSQRYPLFCVRAHTHTRSKHTVSLCACRRRTRGGRESKGAGSQKKPNPVFAASPPSHSGGSFHLSVYPSTHLLTNHHHVIVSVGKSCTCAGTIESTTQEEDDGRRIVVW